MAKIPKSGIANAQTIQASHITNIIEALDGTGSYDVVATGSFTGSFTGDGSNITGVTAEWDGTHVGNAEITGSLILTGDVTASSYTGSFVGDGSGLDGVVATTLFALSQGSGVRGFTFDGTSTQTITISGSAGLTTDTITKWTGDAFADTSITDDGAVVDINSDTTITGSLTATGLTQGGGTDTVAMYDTGSGQFFYTASSAIGGGGSDTNFANTNLTLDSNRTHDLNGFRLIFESASSSAFSIASNTGVSVNAGQADRDFRVYTQGNTSTLFVEGSSDRVGVGKNTPNATLDVNGNAIISGSLSMESGQRIYSDALVGLTLMQPTETTAVRASQVVTNNVSIASNISGSGVHPGMNAMIDLSQSSANTIKLALSPIGEYTLGSSYVIYLSDSPAGGTESFRLQTSGGGESFTGTIAALSSPISVSGATLISTNAGDGEPGDRITITKISDDIWQVEGSVKDGSNWTVV